MFISKKSPAHIKAAQERAADPAAWVAARLEEEAKNLPDDLKVHLAQRLCSSAKIDAPDTSLPANGQLGYALERANALDAKNLIHELSGRIEGLCIYQNCRSVEIPEDYARLLNAFNVSEQTDKAVKMPWLINSWLPKSQILVHNGCVIAVASWLADKYGALRTLKNTPLEGPVYGRLAGTEEAA